MKHKKKLTLKTKRLSKKEEKRKSKYPWWVKIVYQAGKNISFQLSGNSLIDKIELNKYWYEWLVEKNINLSWDNYLLAMRAFRQGYFDVIGQKSPDWILIPTLKTTGIVLSIMNEEETISGVLQQIERLPLHEILLVLNGSNDQTYELVKEFNQVNVVYYPFPLGHDVGRAIGAHKTNSDIVIFTDGDFIVEAELYLPFIKSIEMGADIALNNISPYVGPFKKRDNVTIVKEFLNRVMGKPYLSVNSLTAVPNALSRKAIHEIGYENLIVPPKALAMAILKGLQIETPTSINVLVKNRHRIENTGRNNQISELIIGDHVEAIHHLLNQYGERYVYDDIIRKRDLIVI